MRGMWWICLRFFINYVFGEQTSGKRFRFQLRCCQFCVVAWIFRKKHLFSLKSEFIVLQIEQTWASSRLETYKEIEMWFRHRNTCFCWQIHLEKLASQCKWSKSEIVVFLYSSSFEVEAIRRISVPSFKHHQNLPTKQHAHIEFYF